jgi:hypothetical protein
LRGKEKRFHPEGGSLARLAERPLRATSRCRERFPGRSWLGAAFIYRYDFVPLIRKKYKNVINEDGGHSDDEVLRGRFNSFEINYLPGEITMIAAPGKASGMGLAILSGKEHLLWTWMPRPPSVGGERIQEMRETDAE